MKKIDKRSKIWKEMSEEDQAKHIKEYKAYVKANKPKNGGARKGAGRKPKADEMKLIERLDSIIDQDEVLDELKKMAVGYTITKTNSEGEDYEVQIQPDLKAIQIYMNYRFGRPRETKDININPELPLFNLGDEE